MCMIIYPKFSIYILQNRESLIIYNCPIFTHQKIYSIE